MKLENKELSSTNINNFDGLYVPKNGSKTLNFQVKDRIFKDNVSKQNAFNFNFNISLGQETFKVNFDTQGGTAVNYISAKNGGTITLPSANSSTKTGYTLQYWQINGKNYTPGSKYTVPIGDSTLKAIWKNNTYTVKFDGNGADSGSMSNQTVTFDIEQALNKNTFVKTGYTFKGWNVSRKSLDGTKTLWMYSLTDGTRGWYVEGQNPSGTEKTLFLDQTKISRTIAINNYIVTMHAQWSANTYILTFIPNGGSVSPTSKSLTYGSQYGNLPTPTRTGYTFNGWYDWESDAKVSSTTTIGANNVTIYARWTIKSITVTFDAGKYGGFNNNWDQAANIKGSFNNMEINNNTGQLSPKVKTGKINEILTLVNKTNFKPGKYYLIDFSINNSQNNVTFDPKASGNPSINGKILNGNWEKIGSHWFFNFKCPDGVNTNEIRVGHNGFYLSWNNFNMIGLGNFYITEYDKQINKTVNYGSHYNVPTVKNIYWNVVNANYSYWSSSSGGSQITNSTIVNNENNHTIYARWSDLQNDDSNDILDDTLNIQNQNKEINNISIVENQNVNNDITELNDPKENCENSIINKDKNAPDEIGQIEPNTELIKQNKDQVIKENIEDISIKNNEITNEILKPQENDLNFNDDEGTTTQ